MKNIMNQYDLFQNELSSIISTWADIKDENEKKANILEQQFCDKIIEFVDFLNQTHNNRVKILKHILAQFEPERIMLVIKEARTKDNKEYYVPSSEMDAFNIKYCQIQDKFINTNNEKGVFEKIHIAIQNNRIEDAMRIYTHNYDKSLYYKIFDK